MGAEFLAKTFLLSLFSGLIVEDVCPRESRTVRWRSGWRDYIVDLTVYVPVFVLARIAGVYA